MRGVWGLVPVAPQERGGPRLAEHLEGLRGSVPSALICAIDCRYVCVESGDLSLLLRKSVEARDWLSTVEPRSVRAVMKRIVEDVTIIGRIFI